ncbi:MAG: DNA primase [Crocinitomicaceae bacterium]|nr:DNA primase [Crocinitomicaceae bacterium]|tara:strand:- start:875 stop:2854 length:1980 start_codon:yes stop_codon:yes gene_type:complete
MIPTKTVELIHQTAIIEDVVGDYVELKKQGSSYRGLSPFTSEKTPSFYVVPSKGIFKCFSSGKGGSLMTFVMAIEKVSYPEALRIVARKYNIEIVEKEKTAEEIQAETARESLGAVVSWAQKWFSDQLETEQGKAIGLAYFESRGFREDIIEKFKVGYCPTGWEVMTKAAVDAGYKEERLEQSGLCKKKQDGTLFDFFQGRVMFPIRDVTGRVIGFGGRTLKTDKKIAKYFNSPESPLYDKSKALYGIHLAKNHITKEDSCFLVEGYTDVMAMHQSGLENVVASSGTALTIGQIALIRRFTKNVTVLFDGDAAGMRASLRGIDLLLKEGMKVKVVTFPDGDDPDSYSKKVSSTELQEFVKKGAQDFLAFKSDLLSEGAGDDPIKKAELVKSLVDTLACIPDQIQRTVYIQTIAARLKLQEKLLHAEVAKKVASDIAQEQKRSNRVLFPPQDYIPSSYIEEVTQGASKRMRTERNLLEDNLVRLLLEHGESMVKIETQIEESAEAIEVDVTFAELLIHRVESQSISMEDPSTDFILSKFTSSLDLGEIPSAETFFTGTTEDVQKKAADMLVHKYTLSENWEERHHIFSMKEEDDLEKALSTATIRIQLHDVQRNIDLLLEQLDNGDCSDEEQSRLLREKITLDKKVMELSSLLGVVILPK